MTTKSFYITAAAIIFTAFVLRCIKLTTIPYGLSWDEAAYAANAHSLLMTGKDEWGVTTPLFLKSFGEYKPAALSYILAFFLILLKNPEVATRITAVFLGIVSIVGTITLVRQVTRSPAIALSAGAILSITPWHIHYSKTATDPILGLAFLTIGLSTWLKPNRASIILGSVLLGLSMYTYNAQRVMIPLFVLLWGAYRYKLQGTIEHSRILAYILPIGLATVLIGATMTTAIGTRARETSLWHSQIISSVVQERDRDAKQHLLFVPPITNNKILEFVRAAGERYVAQFRLDFLFFSQKGFFADLGFSQHGNMLFVMLPFWIIGMVFAIKRTTQAHTFFLLLLFVAPIPAALTIDGPHTGRSLSLVLPLCYFIVIGLRHCVEELASNRFRFSAITLIISGFFMLATGFWYQDYLLFAPKELNREYQGYNPMLSKKLADARSLYDTIFVSGRERGRHQLLYMVLYQQLDPTPLQFEINPESIHTRYENISLIQSQEKLTCALTSPRSLVVLLPDEFAAVSAEPIPHTQVVSPTTNEPQYFLIDTANVPNQTRVSILQSCPPGNL